MTKLQQGDKNSRKHLVFDPRPLETLVPAEQGEDVILRECIIDTESSGNGERAFLHQPLIEPDEVKGCLAG